MQPSGGQGEGTCCGVAHIQRCRVDRPVFFQREGPGGQPDLTGEAGGHALDVNFQWLGGHAQSPAKARAQQGAPRLHFARRETDGWNCQRTTFLRVYGIPQFRDQPGPVAYAPLKRPSLEVFDNRIRNIEVRNLAAIQIDRLLQGHGEDDLGLHVDAAFIHACVEEHQLVAWGHHWLGVYANGKWCRTSATRRERRNGQRALAQRRQLHLECAGNLVLPVDEARIGGAGARQNLPVAIQRREINLGGLLAGIAQ